MDHAAQDLMAEYRDIVLAFGESDEYSFLLRKSTALYNRRQAKLVSTLTSYFTSCYVFHWREYFANTPMRYPSSFDGRIVLYPSEHEVRDYFSWRQTDTHINNLYNTVFWALVQQGGESTTQAHATLKGTVSGQKHEILFSRFGTNYNQISARFRKGSVLVQEEISVGDATDESTEPTHEAHRLAAPVDTASESKAAARRKKEKKSTPRTTTSLYHCDIIGQDFWDARPHLLDS